MNTKEAILATAIAVVILVAAVGSASAVTVVNSCDFHANTAGDYVLGQNLDCDPGVTAIWVEANNVTIDGYNATDDTYYKMSGDLSGGLTYGVFSSAQDDVTIKNLEVEHFGTGIRIYGLWDDSMKMCLSGSNRPTIDNCTVHDCGLDDIATHGIQFVCAPDGSITNCTVFNNIGNVAGGCADGGNGIQLFGHSGNTIVDNNRVYNNRLAGIYSKARCWDCNITNNTVYGNGMVTGVAYFGGGIRFQCKNSHREHIINNTVTDNFGPGIFMGGNDCILRNNTVTGSKDVNNGANARGDGFRNDRYADSGGLRTDVYDNLFCNNEHLDINVENAAQDVTGDDNTCNSCANYNDEGETCCTNSCPTPLTFEKELVTGWNLVSLPLMPSDKTVSSVLNSLVWKYDTVVRYDAATHQFIELSPDSEMNNGVGYFIHINETGTFTWNYSGADYDSINVGLSQGLNCIGWTNTSVSLPGALNSIADYYNYVTRWNATLQSYEVYEPNAPAPFNDFAEMERGVGYFIAAKGTCTLTYP